MSHIPQSEIFEKLAKNTHTIKNTQTNIDIFNNTPNTDTPQETEYWRYSDFHNMYGNCYFPTSPNMDANVYKHIYMPRPPISKRGKVELIPSNTSFHDTHVVPIHHSFTLGYNQYKNATDLCLSRYACWCLMRQSPNLMFERLYFLHPDIRYIDLHKMHHEFYRIQLRAQLSEYEKRMNGILYHMNANFALFNHETSRPFFGQYSNDELRSMYNIKNKSASLFDYVGPLTLIARINALALTINTYNQKPRTTSAHDLSYILGDALVCERRKLKYELNTYPEADIRPNLPVKKLIIQLNNIEQKFIKEFSYKKLR